MEIRHVKLYNWYAVNDSRGLAPKGWFVPMVDDLTELVDYLGGDYEAGLKLKSTSGWNENGNGDNKSGLNCESIGLRNLNGNFENKGITAAFWSKSLWLPNEKDQQFFIRVLDLYFGSNGILMGTSNPGIGLPVRCLRH